MCCQAGNIFQTGKSRTGYIFYFYFKYSSSPGQGVLFDVCMLTYENDTHDDITLVKVIKSQPQLAYWVFCHVTNYDGIIVMMTSLMEVVIGTCEMRWH